MLTGIDHFIVAVSDPDVAAAELEQALGLQASAGGRHEAYGSFNRLIWLGDSYLELLGLTDRALAAQTWFGPRALEVLDGPGGAGYVGLALATDEIDSYAAGLQAQGSLLGIPEAGLRVRPDGGIVRWKTATAARGDPDLGQLFLIEHDTKAAEWTPADRQRRAMETHPAGGPLRLARVELAVSNMQAATMRLHRDLGLQFRPSLAGGGARDASVGGQLLRLTRRQPDSLPHVVLAGGPGARPAELVAFGCRWSVESHAAQPG